MSQLYQGIYVNTRDKFDKIKCPKLYKIGIDKGIIICYNYTEYRYNPMTELSYADDL